jgi:hypothetical protein
VSQYAPWAHPKQAGQGRGVVQNTILCVPSCLSSSLFFCHHCSLRLILLTGNAHIVLSPSTSAPLSTPPQFWASSGLQQLDSRATPINAVSASFDAFLCLCHLQSATTPPGRGSPMGAMAHYSGPAAWTKTIGWCRILGTAGPSTGYTVVSLHVIDMICQ